MLVVLRRNFVADTKLIYSFNFVAPLTSILATFYGAPFLYLVIRKENHSNNSEKHDVTFHGNKNDLLWDKAYSDTGCQYYFTLLLFIS